MKAIEFKMSVLAHVKVEDGTYISHCPALEVYSQGATEQGAISNLVEALQLFLESCYERGTFEQVLRECNFRPSESLFAIPHEKADGLIVDVPLPLLIQQNNNAKNHAC